MSLDEALERAIKVYEREQRHPAPTDVVAQGLGYKSANSGAALTTIAALRSYGLLESMGSGMLAVDADVQSYCYAPDQALRQELLIKWLRSPALFSTLLGKYKGGLPSDLAIMFDLTQNGFQSGKAQSVLKSFKRSVEFTDYYQQVQQTEDSLNVTEDSVEMVEQPSSNQNTETADSEVKANGLELDVDRIPVRLDAKRRAWLEIPSPFYNKDKERLKAQIDLLLTDEEA